MKALLVKDLALLSYRKQNLLIYLAVCLIMAFTTDSSFVITYMSFLGVMLATSTISYDELDNGQMYINTWPIENKDYVLGKYVLAFIASIFACLLSLVATTVINFLQTNIIDTSGLLPTFLIANIMIMLIISFTIPMQLKFGGEKSRIVTLLVFGLLFAGLYLLAKIIDVNVILNELENVVTTIKPFVLIAMCYLVCFVLVLLSIAISNQIMKKKTY